MAVLHVRTATRPQSYTLNHSPYAPGTHILVAYIGSLSQNQSRPTTSQMPTLPQSTPSSSVLQLIITTTSNNPTPHALVKLYSHLHELGGILWQLALEPEQTHHIPDAILLFDQLTHSHTEVCGLLTTIITDGAHNIGGLAHLQNQRVQGKLQ